MSHAVAERRGWKERRDRKMAILFSSRRGYRPSGTKSFKSTSNVAREGKPPSSNSRTSSSWSSSVRRVSRKKKRHTHTQKKRKIDRISNALHPISAGSSGNFAAGRADRENGSWPIGNTCCDGTQYVDFIFGARASSTVPDANKCVEWARQRKKEAGRGGERRKEKKSRSQRRTRRDNKTETLSTHHRALRRLRDKYSFSEQRSVALQDRTIESFSS